MRLFTSTGNPVLSDQASEIFRVEWRMVKDDLRLWKIKIEDLGVTKRYRASQKEYSTRRIILDLQSLTNPARLTLICPQKNHHTNLSSDRHDMDPATVTLDYISVGGNRHPAAADWDHRTGVLAFGADNNIAIWDPLVRRVCLRMITFVPPCLYSKIMFDN
jgi:hypothetical protein